MSLADPAYAVPVHTRIFMTVKVKMLWLVRRIFDPKSLAYKFCIHRKILWSYLATITNWSRSLFRPTTQFWFVGMCREGIPLPMPKSNSDFVDIIRTVRESRSGIELRELVREAGYDINFTRQEECWRAISYELARRVTGSNRIDIRAEITRGAKEVPSVVVTAGMKGFPKILMEGSKAPGVALMAQLIGEVGYRLVGPVVTGVRHLYKQNHERRSMQRHFEGAVQFRFGTYSLPRRQPNLSQP